MKPPQKIKKFWKILGPGLVTGAADDDPSGIATYSQAGAQYNLQLLWLALFSLPFMVVVQEMCARIGLVTECGLSENIKKNYPRPLVFFFLILLFTANTFNIGANLGAMAACVKLIFPQINFFLATLLFTTLTLILEIFLTYQTYSKYLKYLTFVLFAYIFAAFFITIDWNTVLKRTVIPSINFDTHQILMICAVLGTTISPYLFFWQSSQEVEEKKEKKKKNEKPSKTIKYMRWDVFAGMFISTLIMYFIIIMCASTLFTQGINDIKSISDAAVALKPIAGQWAVLLFIIGIIGTGLLSIPVLATSSAYAIAETFSWKKGLSKKIYNAPSFYSVIIISMLIALGLNFFNVDPMKGLIYSAILNGIAAPGILFLVVRLASNKKIMGSHSNHLLLSIIGWIITAIMTAVAAFSLIDLFIKN